MNKVSKWVITLGTLALFVTTALVSVQTAEAAWAALGNVSTTLPPFCETGAAWVAVGYHHDLQSGYIVQARMLEPGAEEWETESVFEPVGAALFKLPAPEGGPYPDHTLFTIGFRIARIDENGNYILYDEKVVNIDCTSGKVFDPPLSAETRDVLYKTEEADLYLDPQETVLPAVPEITEAAQAVTFNEQTACAVFEIDLWGSKYIDPAFFPDCQQYTAEELQVACLAGDGQWTEQTAGDVSIFNGALYATITQHGTCGIFPVADSSQ